MGSFAQALIDEAAREAVYNSALEIAKRMVNDHLSLNQIAKYSMLDKDTIEELATELGVILPDTPVLWTHPTATGKAQAVTPEAS